MCKNRCETCNTDTKCLTCATSIISPRDAKKDCACATGYFDDGKNADCVKCPSRCLSCSNLDTCDICVISIPVRSLAKDCACNDKYYDNGSDTACHKCLSYCGTCDNASDCLTCGDSTPKRDIKNKCACPVSYFDDLKST